MKSIMYLFSFIMLSSMTFKNNVTPGDGIPGMDVKVGHKPPGGGQIIATGVTDKNGTFEFKNLPPLSEGQNYYVEFGIKEQGIKASSPFIKIDGQEEPKRKKNADINQQTQPVPQIITQKLGDVEVTVTIIGNTIRGSINVSRSNIKNR
jgi:hypothetical protein